MFFRILGPLEAGQNGDRLPLGPPRQRAVLAALLLQPNQVVPTGQLIDSVWGQQPPPTVRPMLQSYVSQLRAVLPGCPDRPGGPARIVFERPGYRLVVEPGELDQCRFDELAGTGNQAISADDLAGAVRAWRAGLGLWRGRAIEDVAVEPLRWAADRLDQQRLQLLRRCLEAELRLGRHTAVVAELEALVAAEPLREDLRQLAMAALYRCGRTADALACYTKGRSLLVGELGVEPGPGLRRLHRAILAGAAPAELEPVIATSAATAQHHAPGSAAGRQDDRPATPPGTPRPAELPADIADFTGRDAELALLTRHLAAGAGPVPVVSVAGTGGVGKSALAVHAAHRLAGGFPDGQLYADLRGATIGATPLEPVEVLGRFLRSFGLAGKTVPADPAEAAARFRSLIADLRVLVVLDNATSTDQVSPLLPGAPGCAVIVTSRRALTSLAGATHLHLNGYAEDEALALLGRVVGRPRLDAEPDAAAGIVRACGHLPLAVRIAGARLVNRPSWPLRLLADRLADQRRRLDEFDLADVSVRASLRVSFRELAADPAGHQAVRLLSLLSLLDLAEVGAPVAAAVADADLDAAERALELLVDAHLLEVNTPGRYRMHDLVRLFATERAERDEPELARVAAVGRGLDHYLATVRTAVRLRRPTVRLAPLDLGQPGVELAGGEAAMDWLDAEQANLLALAKQAGASASTGPARFAVLVVPPLTALLRIRGYSWELIALNQLALRAADRAADRAGAARAHNNLGGFFGELGMLDAEFTHLTSALAIWRETGDRFGEAATLSNLALHYRRTGQYDDGLVVLRQSLSIRRDLGDLAAEGPIRGVLGLLYRDLGRFDEAIAAHQDSLRICRVAGDRFQESIAATNLATTYRLAGHADRALTEYHRSIALSREIGSRYGEAEQLWGLGQTLHDQGTEEAARDCWRQAVDLLCELGTLTSDEAKTLLDQPVPPVPEPIRRNM